MHNAYEKRFEAESNWGIWYEGLLVMQYGKSYDFTEEYKKIAFFLKHFGYRMHLMHFHCVLGWKQNIEHWLVKWLHMWPFNAFSQNEHFIVLYCMASICSFNSNWTSSQVMQAASHGGSRRSTSIFQFQSRSVRFLIFLRYLTFQGLEDPTSSKALYLNWFQETLNWTVSFQWYSNIYE